MGEMEKARWQTELSGLVQSGMMCADRWERETGQEENISSHPSTTSVRGGMSQARIYCWAAPTQCYGIKAPFVLVTDGPWVHNLGSSHTLSVGIFKSSLVWGVLGCMYTFEVGIVSSIVIASTPLYGQHPAHRFTILDSLEQYLFLGMKDYLRME